MEAAYVPLWTFLEMISSWCKLRKRREKEAPTMALTIQTDSIPLRVDEHGVIRVGDTPNGPFFAAFPKNSNNTFVAGSSGKPRFALI
jgi:hypothetical protein